MCSPGPRSDIPCYDCTGEGWRSTLECQCIITRGLSDRAPVVCFLITTRSVIASGPHGRVKERLPLARNSGKAAIVGDLAGGAHGFQSSRGLKSGSGSTLDPRGLRLVQSSRGLKTCSGSTLDPSIVA